jgi:hypothetical protein
MATGSPLPTPSSSRRTSFSTTSPSQSPSPARVPPQRRNRAALRDYYGLKATTPLSPSALGGGDKGLGIGVDDGGADGKKAGEGDGEVKDGEMDREGFKAEEYVRRLLKEESLDGLMRVAGQVVQGKSRFCLWWTDKEGEASEVQETDLDRNAEETHAETRLLQRLES